MLGARDFSVLFHIHWRLVLSFTDSFELLTLEFGQHPGKLRHSGHVSDKRRWLFDLVPLGTLTIVRTGYNKIQQVVS